MQPLTPSIYTLWKSWLVVLLVSVQSFECVLEQLPSKDLSAMLMGQPSLDHTPEMTTGQIRAVLAARAIADWHIVFHGIVRRCPLSACDVKSDLSS